MVCADGVWVVTVSKHAIGLKQRRYDAALEALEMIVGPDSSGKEILDSLEANPESRAAIADWASMGCGTHPRRPSWKCPDCLSLGRETSEATV